MQITRDARMNRPRVDRCERMHGFDDARSGRGTCPSSESEKVYLIHVRADSLRSRSL